MSYKKRYMNAFDPTTGDEFRFFVNIGVVRKLLGRGINLNTVLNETFAKLAEEQDNVEVLDHLIESCTLEHVRLKQEITEHEHAVEFCKEYRKSLQREIDRMKIRVSALRRDGNIQRILDTVSSTIMSLCVGHELGDIKQLLIERGLIAKLEDLGYDFDFNAHLRKLWNKEDEKK